MVELTPKALLEKINKERECEFAAGALMSAKKPVKEVESAFKVYKTGVSKHSRCVVPCWVYGKAEEHGTKQNCWMSVFLLRLLIIGCLSKY